MDRQPPTSANCQAMALRSRVEKMIGALLSTATRRSPNLCLLESYLLNNASSPLQPNFAVRCAATKNLQNTVCQGWEQRDAHTHTQTHTHTNTAQEKTGRFTTMSSCQWYERARCRRLSASVPIICLESPARPTSRVSKQTKLHGDYFLPFTGLRTLKLHIKVSSIVIIAPALSNSPQ